jgi:hypothetical protein
MTQKDNGNEIGKTFDYPVEVLLTSTDLLAYADELTALDDDQMAADSRFNQARGEYKGFTEGVTERRNLILNRIRTKKETRPTPCFNQFDYIKGNCDIVRVDTGEVVKTRKMTDEEYRGDPLFELDEEEVQVN